MTRIILFLVFGVLVLAASGCRRPADADQSAAVVAAFYPLAFAAQQVVGANQSVANLTPAGSEPHDLELTASQVGAIRNAKLVAYLGSGFQPAVEAAVRDRSGPSIDVLAGQELERLPDEDGETALDPHVWLDPIRYAAIAQSIAAALGDPSAADRLVSRLRALDQEYARGLRSCARRTVVTSHAAFGYLARRYRLEQVPLSGISPESEPSAKALRRLVDEVRSSGATTVFFEPLVSAKLAQTVARESGAGVAELDPLESLTQQQLDADGDYFSVMRANLGALRKGLGCT